MGNWAMYQAASGVDNWAQKRQDRAMNLMLSEKMAERADKDLQSQMAIEEGINQRLDEMSQFDVLPEDQKRIAEEEKKARRNIIEGIAKHNGDLKRYMATGGISDIHQYKRNIISSEAVKNAQNNKLAFSEYIDAKKNNKFIGKALVDVPVYDKNGNPVTDKEGKIKTEQQELSMEQQMALFKRGLISKINIGRTEAIVPINPELFKRNYKDEKRPWSADNHVTERDFYNAAIQQGASEEQAKQRALEYGKGLTEKTSWKWKTMNELEMQQAKAKMAYYQSKASKSSSGKSGSSKTMVLNSLVPAINSLTPGTASRYSKESKGGSIPIDNQQSDFWKEYVLRVGKSGMDAHYDDFSQSSKDQGLGNYPLDKAHDVNLTEYVNINGKKMIKAKVTYLDDNLPESFEYSTGENRNNFKETTVTIKDEDNELEEVDAYEGYVYIPIDDEIKSDIFKASLNRMAGYKSDQHDAPASIDTDERMQGMLDYQRQQAETLRSFGIPEDEIERILNESMF